MATEKELEALDKKFESLQAEFEELLKKYGASFAQTYDGGMVFFDGEDQGNREYYL